MVEKSSFLGCFNPCKFGFQNFSVNQVRPAGFGLFEQAFPNDMGECEECKTRFNFLKRKKLCNDCGLGYCTSCLTRFTSGERQCRKCKILGCWPINKAEISSLRVRDLRHFLSTCKISTNTYKEKQELIDLVIVQLKIKHKGRSQNYHQNFANPQSNINTATSSTTAASFTTRDDGIRVRPQTTNFDEIHLPTTSAAAAAAASVAPSTGMGREDIEDDGTGIRVFPFSQEGDVASASDPQPCTHHDQSDDTTSSSWSLLQPDPEEMHISSSSESLSDSFGLENPSNNVPPDNEEDILQEVHMPSTDSSPNETENAGGQEDAEHLNAPAAADSKLTCVADVIKLSSLADEESIKELSVRQCKEILILHRVDFSGVWEKHELVNKVVMLWRDFKERQGEKDWSEDQLCKICMDAAIDCVLLECGHMLSCTNCGKQMAECPICRQNVVRVVKTFRA